MGLTAEMHRVKTLYEWGRKTLRRIDLFVEDTAKKPEIPQTSKMARLHQRILNARRKRNHGKA